MLLTTRTRNSLVLVAAAAATLACGNDDPTSPDPLTFPEWPSAVISGFCVRGTAVVGDTKSGTISDTDCAFNPVGSGYFEVWRVRVASSRDVSFDANSTFDNFLRVIRVNSVTATDIDGTLVGENDDRSPPSNLNALVTVRLEPNVDYAVFISGFDNAETGPYTLAIR